MLKTNLEILQEIKERLEIATKSAGMSASAYLHEDIINYETISKKLSEHQRDYAIQLVLESLIEFIEGNE